MVILCYAFVKVLHIGNLDTAQKNKNGGVKNRLNFFAPPLNLTDYLIFGKLAAATD